MSFRQDLERKILESYAIIQEHETIIETATQEPERRRRSQHSIDYQWGLIENDLAKYVPLCERLGEPIAPRVLEIALQLDEYAYLAVSPPTDDSKIQKGRGGADRTGRTFSGIRYRWAVLVGVTHYEDAAIGDLHVCAGDVRTVHDVLVTNGATGYDYQRVRLLIDQAGDSLPTRADIMGSLAALARSADPEDMLLFYFSGHGIEYRGEAYLLPRDARYTALADTSVSLTRVKQLVAESSAHAKVIILDACHSGARIGKAAPAMSGAFIRRVFEEAEGTAILSSCKQQEVSWEWPEKGCSAFTYHLLEGLRGAADFDGKGFVSVNDVSRYVTDGVKSWAAKRGLVQTPTREDAMVGDIILSQAHCKLEDS